MKKIFTNYFSLILIIITIGIILGSCGGDNSGLSPNLSQNPLNTNPTPTPVLVSKPVSGYIYITSPGIEAKEEGEENIKKINILEVPAFQPDSSGNIPLVNQVLTYLQEEYPEDWNKPESQELYSQLSTSLSQSKPLPEYDSQAKLFTIYQDSKNSDSIPVSSDGHFEGNALTGLTDSTVKYEIALGEEKYLEAEGIISSDNLTSSDATGVTIKSCPEKIFALPGEVVIFKVYSDPAINLKEAGLRFTLNNTSLGYVFPMPVYLDICGHSSYTTGYGFFYAKRGLTTPVDTTITAYTNTGLTLDIFTEVIKSSASISGHVYTGGNALVGGYVRSIGPDAFCFLDAEGNYTLSKTFRGHYREIVCVYWVREGEQVVRHREEKVIEFFNGDLTGFNFGLIPTPTPTSTPTPLTTLREPTDPFYCETSMRVMIQRDRWAEDLGLEQAVQKTVNWLNGNMTDYPIPEGIAWAKVDDSDPTIIWIKFTDGRLRFIATNPLINDNLNSQDSIPKQLNKETHSNLQRNTTTVGSDKVKILAPFAWIDNTDMSVYGRIWQKLVAANYDKRGSICKATTLADVEVNMIDDEQHIYKTTRSFTNDTITAISTYIKDTTGKDITEAQKKTLEYLVERNYEFEKKVEIKDLSIAFPDPNQIDVIWDNMMKTNYYKIDCIIKSENIIRPEDFQDLTNYGVIYIKTHGLNYEIGCGPIYKGDNYLKDHGWLNDNNKYDPNDPNSTGIWCVGYLPYNIHDKTHNIEIYFLTKNFFKTLPNQDFSKSLIYINACYSFNFLELPDNPLHSAKAYLGFSKAAGTEWANYISYYFFLYLIEGYQRPIEVFPGNASFNLSDPDPYPPAEPMSIQKALATFSQVLWTRPKYPTEFANPDPNPYDPQFYNPNDNPTDCELKLTVKDPNEDIYFPVPVTITVEKK